VWRAADSWAAWCAATHMRGSSATLTAERPGLRVLDPGSLLLLAVVAAAASHHHHAQASDPYYPVFHARPASGHVNDPNAPMIDPATGLVHLFMQYSPAFPYRPHKIAWAHLISSDWAHWRSIGVAIQPDGQGCNNTRGAYTGSASIVGGVPTIFYPGVHFNTSASFPYLPDRTSMDQCIATPVNRTDKTLKKWQSRVFIPANRTPTGVTNHFHDDSNAWVSEKDRRWYMFVSGCGCRHETGPCIPPNCSHATNILYSSADLLDWRQEHSLFNYTGYGNFVSCPELYTLPGLPSDQAPLGSSDSAVYYGNGQYWLGRWDDGAKLFTPRPAFLPPLRPSRGYMYDYGEASASKSFWDAERHRRVQWAYIDDCTSSRRCQRSTRPGWSYVASICPADPARCWDNAQTVARVITLRAGHLHIAPLPELDLLRSNGGEARVVRSVHLGPGETAPLGAAVGTVCDIVLNVSDAQAGGSIRVLASADGATFTEIAWNASAVSLRRDRSGSAGRRTSLSMPLHRQPLSSISLRIFLDNFVVEVFELVGGTVLTAVVFPPHMDDASHASIVGGSASVDVHAEVFGMTSCMLDSDD
jgi:sucrose-6-phosphate hydrolase SacC (GH32 family)